MKLDNTYKVPDIIDCIYEDVVSYSFFNSLNPIRGNRVKMIKCNIACDLLLKSETTLEGIAELAGFPDTETLNSSLEEYLAISPLEFRRRFGQKK